MNARQFRRWADDIGRIVREMESTPMHDGTPVLCGMRAAYYIALATADAAEAPRPPAAPSAPMERSS